MKKNRIEIFNRLTSDTEELDDVEVFEDLVGDSYPKFCYLYEIISGNGLIDHIDTINCKTYSDRVEFIIYLNRKITKRIEKLIDNNVKEAAGMQCDFYCNEKNDHCLVMSVF